MTEQEIAGKIMNESEKKEQICMQEKRPSSNMHYMHRCSSIKTKYNERIVGMNICIWMTPVEVMKR
jgi:hypothetical protein